MTHSSLGRHSFAVSLLFNNQLYVENNYKLYNHIW